MAKASSRHVALLRGINVGGKNMLPMKELAAMFARAGCGDVVTYIQSGNVVFRATDQVAAGLSGAITSEVEKRFGMKVPVVLRSAAEIAAVISRNSFLINGASEEMLHV